MRRRRDQPNAWNRIAKLRDVLRDLVARELSSLAGLRALRHLDLQLIRVDEVLRSNAEASRSDLLDLGAQRVALLHWHIDHNSVYARLQSLAFLYRQVAARILAAFPRIRFPADAIHRDGEGRMRFSGDRTETHCAGREPLHDFGRRLDFLQRHRFWRKLELEEPAQRHQPLALLVDEPRVVAIR